MNQTAQPEPAIIQATATLHMVMEMNRKPGRSKRNPTVKIEMKQVVIALLCKLLHDIHQLDSDELEPIRQRIRESS